MKQTISIEGMTCVACEMIICEELKIIKGVNKVVVSYKKKTAEIHYSGQEPEFDKISEKIKKLGYRVTPTSGIDRSSSKIRMKQWLYALMMVLGLYFVYQLISSFGWLNWLEVDTAKITFGVAFLVGIVASLSTCLVVVGAVVLSFASKYQSSGSFYRSNIQPHLLFHLGRLATFFFLGGLLGVIGGSLNFSSTLVGWFTVFIAVVLAWLGLNIIGLIPSLSAVGLRMPKKVFKIWQNLKTSEHRTAPLILGGLTFFLPCGFTQSMQLFALSSQSFWQGALTMFFFALGTAPVLVSLGVTATRLNHQKKLVFKKVVGLIVILFSLYTLTSGLALAGVSTGLLDKKISGQTIDLAETQVIEMNVGYQGFSPNVFKLKKGVPVKWVINGQQVTGCTNEIIIPEFGLKQKIYSGENIIEFTPSIAGTIGFSCWMGMVRGKFIIEDGEAQTTASPPAAVQDNSLNSSCSGGGTCGGTYGTAGCGCGGR